MIWTAESPPRKSSNCAFYCSPTASLPVRGTVLSENSGDPISPKPESIRCSMQGSWAFVFGLSVSRRVSREGKAVIGRVPLME